MNDHITLAAGSGDMPVMLKIIFWILLILWAIGAIGFPTNPQVVRGTSVLLIILFAILGWAALGF